MRYLISLLLASLALSAPIAHADTRVETPILTVQGMPDSFTPMNSISLISQTANETRISLNDMNGTWRQEGGSSLEISDWYLQNFHIEVSAGYRVTGIGLGTTASAAAEVATNVDIPGSAKALDFMTGIYANDGATWAESTLAFATDVTTPVPVAATLDNQMLSGHFNVQALTVWNRLILSGYIYAARDLPLYEVPSYLHETQADTYLVFYTAAVTAVPEPGQWMMVLLGLALLGLCARKMRDRSGATMGIR
jgi:hypothetical protein